MEPPTASTAVIAAIIAGIGLVVAVGLLGYWIGQSGSEATIEAAPTTAVAVTSSPSSTAPPETIVATTAARAATSTTTAPATTAPTTTAAPATTEPSTTTTAAAPTVPTPFTGNIEDADRLAILRGDQLFLTGVVPSEEISQAIEERAAAVLGPENVTNEYVIDPSIEFTDSGPLIVEDVILFESNSAIVNPAFTPLLDLGTLLLSTFPQVTINVVAHTDAVGPADANFVLSERRAEAVAQYWVDQGIDSARIIRDPRGEDDPAVDDDGAQVANRRVEFIITGLLG